MDGIAILLEDLASMKMELDEVLRKNALERQRSRDCCKDLALTLTAIRTGRLRKTIDHLHIDEALAKLNSLTKREKEVLRLIAEGHSTKQIAGKLNISFKTAVSHRTNILRKLDVHESATLVRLAFTAGLITNYA